MRRHVRDALWLAGILSAVVVYAPQLVVALVRGPRS
jgi:hypothetical protein